MPGDVREAEDGHGERELGPKSRGDGCPLAQGGDLLPNLGHRPGPKVHVLGEHALRQGLHEGKARVVLSGRERRWRPVQDRVEDLHRVLPTERGLAGDELVEERPEGVHVGARIDSETASLLRGHVRQRAQQRPRPRVSGVAAPGRPVGGAEDVLLGEAEVEDLEPAVRRHHDVRGLHVAVHDAAGVGLAEGLREAVHNVESRVERRRLPPGVCGEGLSRHVLHGDESDRAGSPVDLVDLVDDGDAGVGEGGGCPGLAEEAGPRLLVGLHVVPEGLEGDAAVQPDVLGEVHLAHSAASEPLQDAVASDRFADHEEIIMAPGGERRGPIADRAGYRGTRAALTIVRASSWIFFRCSGSRKLSA